MYHLIGTTAWFSIFTLSGMFGVATRCSGFVHAESSNYNCTFSLFSLKFIPNSVGVGNSYSMCGISAAWLVWIGLRW